MKIKQKFILLSLSIMSISFLNAERIVTFENKTKIPNRDILLRFYWGNEYNFQVRVERPFVSKIDLDKLKDDPEFVPPSLQMSAEGQEIYFSVSAPNPLPTEVDSGLLEATPHKTYAITEETYTVSGPRVLGGGKRYILQAIEKTK